MCLYGDELYHAQVKIKFMLCYVMLCYVMLCNDQHFCGFYRSINRLSDYLTFSYVAAKYRIYTRFSDRQGWVNSVDRYQTPQNAATDEGMYCLPLIHQSVVSGKQGNISRQAHKISSLILSHKSWKQWLSSVTNSLGTSKVNYIFQVSCLGSTRNSLECKQNVENCWKAQGCCKGRSYCGKGNDNEFISTLCLNSFSPAYQNQYLCK